MVWWIFRRKRVDEQQLQNLIINLRYSFNNIKKDIAAIHNQIKRLEDTDDNIEKRVSSLDTTISNLEPKFKQIEYNSRRYTKEKITKPDLDIKDQNHSHSIIKSLTTTQQEIFRTIYTIQHQLETEDVSIKSLAKVYYPDKKYSDVRSTISEYLTILSTLGLVSKKRKGKETFVSLTNIGSKAIEQIKKKYEEKEDSDKNEPEYTQ
ncbi:hypothetical protein J4214_03695 [Candidatus Woesearchaeota archaeon]|nr:hypothetical protein [Candidatus Woesearchaeota archaeon]